MFFNCPFHFQLTKKGPMRNFKYLVLSVLVIPSSYLMAAPCQDVSSCAKLASELTGQKYILGPASEKKRISFTDNIKMTKENAELLFTNVLYQHNLTRVPVSSSDKNSFFIVETKE